MGKKVTVKDLARGLKNDKGIGTTYRDNELLLKTVFDLVRETIMEGNDVALSGLGTFKLSTVEEREGRNPATGESITIPEHTQIKFKVLPSLKQDVR